MTFEKNIDIVETFLDLKKKVHIKLTSKNFIQGLIIAVSRKRNVIVIREDSGHITPILLEEIEGKIVGKKEEGE